MRRFAVIGLTCVLLGLGLAAAPQATAGSPARCGPGDLPETGLQGDVPREDQQNGRALQGYNCGISLVGYSDLGGRGSNANMAWAGDCAYIAGDGVAIVDVSDPTQPQHVGTLRGPGSDDTLETLHAVTTADRAVLVAGRYGLVPTGGPAPMDIYDVTDCAHPRLTATFTWPKNIHNLTITADGRRVFATLPLQVADISDLAHPRFLGNLDDQIPTPPPPARNLAHEAWPSADGTRLYIGGQVVGIGDYLTVLDIAGWPARPPVVLSQTNGRGHSVRQATIGGRRYLLNSEESIVDPTAKGCVHRKLNPFAGAAQPWLTDITDERHPVRVSQFRLEINDPLNCAAQVASGVNASVHYHDVDNAQATTFAMLSMWNAGLRVVDVRDARHPTEVGYFNPGAFPSGDGQVVLDQAWGHVRYVPETGHIWFATQTGGFWVVELEPHVRAALGLPALPSPTGSGVAGPTFVRPAVTIAAPRLDVTPAYCTLSTLAAG